MTSMIALHQMILMILMMSEVNGKPDYLGNCQKGLLVDDPCEVGMIKGSCVVPLRRRRPCKRCPLQCQADVNECALRTARCDLHASCTNTRGSFICTCHSGYRGDGHTCTDDNECYQGTANCDVHASCTNTFGSFTCSCNSGYSGDGYTCTDDNECTLGTAKCGVQAACTNTLGSYTCSCTSEYSGDGLTCTAICDNGLEKKVKVGTTLYSICTCSMSKAYECDKELVAKVKVGARVIPGKDWSWSARDAPGTITKVVSQGYLAGVVYVKWDNGESSRCRMGYREYFDLSFV